jgi:hypothetical protein
MRTGGTLVVVHNTITGERQTRERLEAGGLRSEVLLRHRGPLGPVGRAAAALLRERGVDTPEQEETVVISGRRGNP